VISQELSAQLARLATLPTLLICSDFDGTLSPIVPIPSDARPIAGAVAVMDQLATLPHTLCVLISGRAVTDLKILAGTGPEVILVGSHGAEFSEGFTNEVDPGQMALLADVVAEIETIVADAECVRLEVKPISVAVHVRQCAPDLGEEIVSAVTAGPARLPGVHVTEGKQVIELSVQPVDKGSAITMLRERHNVYGVLFLGDDVTDERGFVALHANDVGVKVGVGESAATYRVADPIEVLEVLIELLRLRRSKPSG